MLRKRNPQPSHPMTQRANGNFTVVMTPQPLRSDTTAVTPGRMQLDKTYSGDLVATAAGEMLIAMTPKPDSAGYVAIEWVSGTLHGRQGSFALLHSGTMDRGAPQLSVTVVPDSGSAALTGLTGSLAIRREGGQHFYDFDYSLPA